MIFTKGGWFRDCPVTYTHPSEIGLWKSFDGLGVIDLEIFEFADLVDT